MSAWPLTTKEDTQKNWISRTPVLPGLSHANISHLEVSQQLHWCLQGTITNRYISPSNIYPHIFLTQLEHIINLFSLKFFSSISLFSVSVLLSNQEECPHQYKSSSGVGLLTEVRATPAPVVFVVVSVPESSEASTGAWSVDGGESVGAVGALNR